MTAQRKPVPGGGNRYWKLVGLNKEKEQAGLDEVRRTRRCSRKRWMRGRGRVVAKWGHPRLEDDETE
jgi:hypothetical protein